MTPATPTGPARTPPSSHPTNPSEPHSGDGRDEPQIADDGPSGMTEEGAVTQPNAEGVESEAETRRNGGMIGEG